MAAIEVMSGGKAEDCIASIPKHSTAQGFQKKSL